ncbi:MAG: hypothetical protein V1836_03460 [Candidatus Aenigmatarchaeota archaeon]
MTKGVTNVISIIMLTLGAVVLVGAAYAWQNGLISRLMAGGVYADTENFCTNVCFIDAVNIANVLVPLDGSTVVNARIANNGLVDKTYAIKYYPNFTAEVSMVASAPTVLVPHGNAASAAITLTGLVSKNSEIDFDIMAVNILDNKDNFSFRIKSSVNTSNVPSFGALWFLIVLLSSVFVVYSRSE